MFFARWFSFLFPAQFLALAFWRKWRRCRDDWEDDDDD